MLAREVQERAVRADACVGDDDVDASETLGGRLRQPLERVEVADVALLRDRIGEAEVVAARSEERRVGKECRL